MYYDTPYLGNHGPPPLLNRATLPQSDPWHTLPRRTGIPSPREESLC